MKKISTIVMLLGACISSVQAQQVLCLDSCRAMALRNNKQINASRQKQVLTENLRKSARTKYLPKVDAMGGYEWFSKEISLLSNDQKSALSGMGTNLTTGIGSELTSWFTQLVGQGYMSQETAQQLGSQLQKVGEPIAQAGNSVGERIVDAFHTNTHNIWAGSVMLRMPLYMGGAIVAANNMADISEKMAANDVDMQTQKTLYSIDQAYWTVVSLKQKEKLANSYCSLVKKLGNDVQKMIKQGVATRADGLKVDVKVNEAEMTITQVEDGLVLAKMLLSQLCGLPMDEEIILADENKEALTLSGQPIDTERLEAAAADSATSTRPELRLLQNAVELTEQGTKLARAAFLPHVALTGGYMISNPNVFNGFQNKFAGTWNIGVLVQVPLITWGDRAYKVRATRAATNIAQMNLDDTREKIHLQITQSKFKVKEARKKLHMAQKNIKSAEENLRCANLGFKEGVMGVTDVMGAQTAWQQAQSQKIDAEINVKLAEVGLNKALGILQ